MAEKDRILPTPLSPGGCARVGRGHSWPSGREDKGWGGVKQRRRSKRQAKGHALEGCLGY